MPNHCDNVIIIHGSDESMKKFRNTMHTKDKDNEQISFSFTQTISIPSGKTNDFYSWNCENWGTKWNPYEIDIIDENDKEVRIQCKTAWMPPNKWASNVINKFDNDLKIKIIYREEGQGFYGTYIIDKNGREDRARKITSNDIDYDNGEIIKYSDYYDFCKIWFN